MLLYFTGLTSTSSECVPKSSNLQHDPIIRKYGEKKQGLTSYTLTLEEQKKNYYPIKGQVLRAFGWFVFHFIFFLTLTVICLVK